MLKRGLLASPNFYAATVHEDQYFDRYFDNLNDVYHVISSCIRGELQIDKLIGGPRLSFRL